MFSVIIPTYNRKEKLKKILVSLQNQTLNKKDFEVLVVDDGSTDGTRAFLENNFVPNGLDLKYFFLSHGGPGKARNLGIEKAQREIVFFCGDDTFLKEDLLEIHKLHHEKKEEGALLGLALWDESQPVTAFMRYLAPAGPQFHYNTIKNKLNAGFDHFYTCNISLAKKWLKEEKFDERFQHGAFEDIELGLRLEKKGLKIIYDPAAKVFHSHFYDEESFGKRMQRVGESLILFLDKYKQDKKTFHQIKKKYAPFLFFPGAPIFLFFSQIMANSKLVKWFSPRYHWFWLVCFAYAQGIIKETKNPHQI